MMAGSGRRFLRMSRGTIVKIKNNGSRSTRGPHAGAECMKWYRYKGGRGWRFEDADAGAGLIIVEAVESRSPFASSRPPGGGPGHVLRTKGAPSSAHTALQDFGASIFAASERFDVAIPSIFGMLAIEATRIKADRSHFNPRSIREEPGFISDEKTPHRVSPGLMQTLISTAREANVWARLYRDVDGSLEKLGREDLFMPERSIMLGTAHMRREINNVEPDEKREGFFAHDPIALCAAYNAGSVREGDGAYHLRTYGGDGRIEKFVAYHNDMCAVLEDRAKA